MQLLCKPCVAGNQIIIPCVTWVLWMMNKVKTTLYVPLTITLYYHCHIWNLRVMLRANTDLLDESDFCVLLNYIDVCFEYSIQSKDAKIKFLKLHLVTLDSKHLEWIENTWNLCMPVTEMNEVSNVGVFILNHKATLRLLTMRCGGRSILNICSNAISYVSVYLMFSLRIRSYLYYHWNHLWPNKTKTIVGLLFIPNKYKTILLNTSWYLSMKWTEWLYNSSSLTYICFHIIKMQNIIIVSIASSFGKDIILKLTSIIFLHLHCKRISLESAINDNVL